MKTVLITLIFTLLAVYSARMLSILQSHSFNLRAFASIVFTSVFLITQPQLAIYLVIASISFYDPRYSWPFIRLWLHQWIIIFSLIVLVGLRIRRREKFSFNRLDLILGIFLSTFVISYVNSPDLAMSVKWTTYFLIFLGGYYLVRLTVSSPRQLVWITSFLILCGAANGLISFFRPVVGGRVGALVLAKPNALGNYLALTLPLPLACLFYGSLSRILKIILSIAVLVITASIILTLSRSSWVGLSLGILTLGIIKPRIKYFAVIIPVLFLILLIPMVSQRLLEDKDDAGVFYRQAKNRVAFQMFKEHPILGQGPGAFQTLAPESEEWAVYAHSGIESLYMRILSEGGGLQAIVFISLVIYVSYLGGSTLRALPFGFLKALIIGSLAGFWAALGIGVGEDPIIFPMVNWLVGFYLGFIVQVRELGIRPGGPEASPLAPS